MSAVTVIISAQYTTMEILIWLQDQTLFLFVALYTVDLRKKLFSGFSGHSVV